MTFSSRYTGSVSRLLRVSESVIPGSSFRFPEKMTTISSISSQDYQFKKGENNRTLLRFGAAFGVSAFGFALAFRRKVSAAEAVERTNDDRVEKSGFAENDKDWPVYSRAEVANHKSDQSGRWVTYGHSVFDITEFASLHPGGDKILLASGGPLEPFWEMYAIHKTEEVFEILNELKIGELDPSDQSDVASGDSSDPYSNDPQRHPALRVVSAKPFNAECPESLITDHFLTPKEVFFVRNHLPVPKDIDVEKYRLKVTIDGKSSELSLSLEELKRQFAVHTITAALQCAGNRRSEMNVIKKVKGLEWGKGAISNAKWRGVKLRDVLIRMGLNDESIADKGLEHVQFEGLDTDITGQSYGASIPLSKAMDPNGDVLLAFEMNESPLTRDHGFPLRVIAPGIVGARNVKWLSGIRVSREESQSHWQQNDYKLFSPSTDWDTVDFKSAPAIQEAPVQSAICEPAQNYKFPKGTTIIPVSGYAWSGGGRGIARVDVSSDGGSTWHSANLQQSPDQSLKKMWSWTLWSVEVPVPEGTGPFSILCKAVDASYNNQPDSVAGIWNLRGCLNNSWCKIDVSVNGEDE